MFVQTQYKKVDSKLVIMVEEWVKLVLGTFVETGTYCLIMFASGSALPEPPIAPPPLFSQNFSMLVSNRTITTRTVTTSAWMQ